MALTANQQTVLVQALTDQAGSIEKLVVLLFTLLLQPRAPQVAAMQNAVAAFRAKTAANLAAVDAAATDAKAKMNTQIADMDAISGNL